MKHWQWKTLANPTEDCIGKKILANASLTSNETLLAKMIAIIDTFVMHKFSITPYMYVLYMHVQVCFRCECFEEFFNFSIRQLNRLCRYLFAERTSRIRQ